MLNPILRSTLVVFLCWWLIIWGLGVYQKGLPDQLLSLETPKQALAVGMFAALLAIGGVLMRRWIAKGWLLETHTRGIVCSIGILPGMVRWPRARRLVRIDANRWPVTAAWLTSARPEYAQAFQAILAVLGANPKFPASPITGGHGGCSLLEHSLNVVETGLDLMDGWTFERRPKDPLHGHALHSDDKDAAVLILAGHDIGKLDAFRLEQGRVVTRKRSHDREGARILATLDEIWSLPEEHRKALIAVVAHEHHPQDLPLHVGDQARLLLEFLIDADNAASQREGGKSASAKQDAASADDTPTDPGVMDEDEHIWSWLNDLLIRPGTINGSDKNFRIGFKGSDGRFYLNEAALRRALAEQCLHDRSLVEARLGDGRYSSTQKLLRILADKRVLVCEWNGERYSYENALFKVEGQDTRGKLITDWQSAIVLDLGDQAHEALRAMSPAPYPPRIVQAVYPNRALKKQPSAPDEGGAQSHDPSETSVERTSQGSDETADAPPASPSSPDERRDEAGDAQSTSAPAPLLEQTMWENDGVSAADSAAPSATPSRIDPPETPTGVSDTHAASSEPSGAAVDPNEDLTSLEYGTRDLPGTKPDQPKSKRSRRSGSRDTRAPEKLTILNAPLPASAPPAPMTFPPELGGLGRAILKGLRKSNQDPPRNEQGQIELTADAAGAMAIEGGVKHQGLDAFLSIYHKNSIITGGIEVVRDPAGRLSHIRLLFEALG